MSSSLTATTTTRRGRLWPLSVAPMVDRTDRHYRTFMRHITRRTLLYTPMITTGAILHGDAEALLAFDALEKPLALQLGGDDPEALAACARIAEARGFDEVNLNVGCPSSRVQSGSFGACLMARPEHVADCVAAMRAACSLPVTVKHRIGIVPQRARALGGRAGALERYEDLRRFVRIVAGANADRFIVHARVAILGGLTPKQNRSIPPLRYHDVYRLVAEHPDLAFEINGGICDVDAIDAQLAAGVAGVMIARAAYDDPYLFAVADARFFAPHVAPAAPPRPDVARAMLPYIEHWTARGTHPNAITRHMLGLFAGVPGGRHYRRVLSDAAQRGRVTCDDIEHALERTPAVESSCDGRASGVRPQASGAFASA
ncbi:MAG: tRNA dihydrouridine(20/20a) synthase DusA [Myxococcales bacterium]|nr:tRNA dihydrouridine(20/20a) synthase DusA [Myxococcales bacterium]